MHLFFNNRGETNKHKYYNINHLNINLQKYKRLITLRLRLLKHQSREYKNNVPNKSKQRCSY
jgi:hypothetical protein